MQKDPRYLEKEKGHQEEKKDHAISLPFYLPGVKKSTREKRQA